MASNTATVATDDLALVLAAIEYAEEELGRARELIREFFAPFLPEQNAEPTAKEEQ
jgi:hypothetical protein